MVTVFLCQFYSLISNRSCSILSPHSVREVVTHTEVVTHAVCEQAELPMDGRSWLSMEQVPIHTRAHTLSLSRSLSLSNTNTNTTHTDAI